ncbi:MAG: hypothetical protein WC554_15020 [Clostridia bacterium]
MKELINQINKRLDTIEQCQKSIDTNLGNHVHTLEIGYAGMSKDMEWIKDGLAKLFNEDKKPKNGENNKESKNDIRTQTDVDWLKRFFWLGISTAITSVASLITILLHTVFKTF